MKVKVKAKSRGGPLHEAVSSASVRECSRAERSVTTSPVMLVFARPAASVFRSVPVSRALARSQTPPVLVTRGELRCRRPNASPATSPYGLALPDYYVKVTLPLIYAVTARARASNSRSSSRSRTRELDALRADARFPGDNGPPLGLGDRERI